MFQLISLGKRALQVTEKQLETTSHNISNKDTEGYSRQRVLQEANFPIEFGFGSIGTGTNIQSIERMRDENLDTEYRNKATDNGSWGKRSEILSQVEKLLKEPSDSGLSNKIDEFFASWDALSSNPSSEAYRIDVATSAEDMTNGFNNLYSDLVSARESINTNIADDVSRINELSEQISNILVQIQAAENQGMEASDLRDKYDLMIDELSQYGNVQIHKMEDNQSIIYFGTDEIARNGSFQKLDLVYEKDGDMDICNPVWAEGDNEINGLRSGELLSLTDLRDNVIPGYIDDLDTMATTLTQEVNAVHLTGYDNQSTPESNHLFFDDSCDSAKNFKVLNIILEDPNKISTSLSGKEGDNRVALEIADIKNKVIINGEKTITQAYSQFVYQVGADASYNASKSDSTQQSLDQTNQFRESVKGVSLNEETANLIKYQQSYQAAAKIISMADEMLTTLMNLVK